MTHPLYVAFVWHMHQPYYKDAVTGLYGLPWVRLHAAKDYVHMGEVLARYPRVHQTFNFVPSLLEQLQEYADGIAVDRHLELSLASQLSSEDKSWMLAHFFSINWDRFIHRYPRYWRLLQVRNQIVDSSQVAEDADLLSDQYWRDVAVWFNLAWIDPTTIRNDPELAALVDRGRNFTRDDADLVSRRHRELCGQVVPLFRRLAASGQVELTTTPYYHPILPLLVDTRAAQAASPGLPLPSILFAHPEDAVEQLERAVSFHETTFGQRPAGLWPSEGAISPAAVDLVARFPSFRWLATDEGILARSLGRSFDRDGYGHLHDPRPLYQPYWIGKTGLAAVFRDQVLSDRIGFVYQHWDSRDAAADLVHRLERMASLVEGDPQPYLVAIILDGENCWESYPNNGEDFLNHLYSALSEHPRLRTVTVGEYLSQHPPRASLVNIATGSWIGANVETWIGEREQNDAWEYLALARSRVVAWQRENPDADPGAIARVWREVYVAEGSDWFWWYYSRNRFGQEDTFDAQYRLHLGNIYRLMGLRPPAWIERSILGPVQEHRRAITAYVTPRVAAEPAPPPDWNGAGYEEPVATGGAMQRGTTLLQRLTYGYNPSELWLRLDGATDLEMLTVAFYIGTSRQARGTMRLRYSAPDGHADGRGDASPDSSGDERGVEFGWELTVKPRAPNTATLCTATGEGDWEECRTLTSVAVRQGVVEVMVPLADLELQLGDTIHLFAGVAGDGVLSETLPHTGVVSFTLTPLA